METYKIIKTLSELSELDDYLKDKEFVTFDTETDGIVKESRIIGFSVCADVEVGYYVVLAHWNKEQQKLLYLETNNEAKTFLEQLKSKKLIMHNAVFDCWMVQNNFKLDLMPSVHTDTLMLGHLLDENRHNGLKELGIGLFGLEAGQQQKDVKESVLANGGTLTRDKYELYKADCDVLAKYGAKDAMLTLQIFYELVPELYAQSLDKFFYEEESMVLLRGPTYELNTTGLKVDPIKLQQLKAELQSECLEAKSFVYSEIEKLVSDKYKGTSKQNTFNIGSPKQLSWLLFFKLDNEFYTLTKEGRNLCKALELRLPYSNSHKREFIRICTQSKGRIYEQSKWNPKTRKMSRPKKVGDAWNYIACDKFSLFKLSDKYKWVKKLLEYNKNLKLLNTYVEGIEQRMQYNVIRPSFLQHGTTSGRYSSKNPNFQNLPRDDKRVKSCIVSRPGKSFVGADYSQLEPRVFASFSGDNRLLDCFIEGYDFYSVIGTEVFERYDCTLYKKDFNSFSAKYAKERDISKVIALSATYGTTAAKMAPTIGKSIREAQEVIDNYFEKFPKVKEFMLKAHEEAKNKGVVVNLFGRPRRMPKALSIKKIYGNTRHSDLPYEIRNLLNLAVNHTIQSTGASIMNRAAIAIYNAVRLQNIQECHIVMQIHDEIILECNKEDSEKVANIVKYCMENTVILPGVKLEAEPKISDDLGHLK